jgi:hypothetical protein
MITETDFRASGFGALGAFDELSASTKRHRLFAQATLRESKAKSRHTAKRDG